MDYVRQNQVFFTMGLRHLKYSFFYKDSKQTNLETVCNSMNLFLTQQHLHLMTCALQSLINNTYVWFSLINTYNQTTYLY